MKTRGTFITRLFAALRGEDGFALVLALGVMSVLGIVGATIATYTTGNMQAAYRSSAEVTSFSLAEAGLNNALAVVENPANNPGNPALLPSSLAAANVTAHTGGVAKWWGAFDSTTSTWTVSSSGYARNATHASDVVRTVSATVGVVPQLVQPLNNLAWNYLYFTRTGTPGGCDQSLADNIDIVTPMYVTGNLCMPDDTKISKGPLVVKGQVTMGSANIGSAAAPLSEAHIGIGCKYKSSPLHKPCTSADHVWATINDAAPPTIAAPVADFGGWYAKAAPGPAFPCTTSIGVVPTFDTNTVRDASVSTVFDLTPAASDYTCQVAASGSQLGGEISWNHTTKTLTVKGTIYIDGSAKITSGAANLYDGQASLYLSGTMLMSGGSKLCATLNAAKTDCDFSTWDPNAKMLVIAAAGTGGQVPAGDSIYMSDPADKGSRFQGALYAAGAVHLNGHSSWQGPMVGTAGILTDNVTNYFPQITQVPVALPGNPVTSFSILAVTNYRG